MKAIQSMMDDSFSPYAYRVAILDLQGKILVATGWAGYSHLFSPNPSGNLQKLSESDIKLSTD
ncbi:MAG: hypothetical protein R2941_03705 [Desulfobacterales bacterium]